ncbi:hypothetical protein O181_064893 [Austropuccinia psidii MF-1]|uniref:Uncharacterized protein n=1 Tax=Austropuccinia psidii MF-1 TaxID=1389203 RepID=A0A9Q3EUE7_9BASI|nr:hypothetical protein [Austropuccinia psidii MF-1]
MKDGNGERTFELGLILTMGFKRQKQNPLNPPDKTQPFNVCLQANPVATHSWSEDLFREPSQHNEPPIPGLSPSSKPPEDVATCEAEPEVAPTQSMEEPFGKSQLFLTPPFPISSLSHYSAVFPRSPSHPPRTQPPPPPWFQAPLIPMIMLARNSPTCNQH